MRNESPVSSPAASPAPHLNRPPSASPLGRAKRGPGRPATASRVRGDSSPCAKGSCLPGHMSRLLGRSAGGLRCRSRRVRESRSAALSTPMARDAHPCKAPLLAWPSGAQRPLAQAKTVPRHDVRSRTTARPRCSIGGLGGTSAGGSAKPRPSHQGDRLVVMPCHTSLAGWHRVYGSRDAACAIAWT